MSCYWNGRESSSYADARDSSRYIIFPDDINAENGELGFCETIFQTIETALNILDAIDLGFLAFSLAKKIKEFIRLLRLLLQEYRNDPNKYRKVLKDLIIQLKELIQELEIEKLQDTINDIVIDQIINLLESIVIALEQVTGIGCTILNFAFLHPIDNQQYDTLCRLIDGRDGIERWLVNNITSVFGLIKFKPTDLNYDRIILSRKNILTRIFDEVCTCIEFGDPPPFTPTPTPTNTCIPCRATQIPVYDYGCFDTLESAITPTIYQLNINGEEIPVSIIDMVDCTENPDILDLLTCTLTTCTPTFTSYFTTTLGTNTNTPISLECIEPNTLNCYIQYYQDLLNFYAKNGTEYGSTPAPVGTPFVEWASGTEFFDDNKLEIVRSGDIKAIKNNVFAEYYPISKEDYLNTVNYLLSSTNIEYYNLIDSIIETNIIRAPLFLNSDCDFNINTGSDYKFRITTNITSNYWIYILDAIYYVAETTTIIDIAVLGCIDSNTPISSNTTSSNSVSSNSVSSSNTSSSSFFSSYINSSSSVSNSSLTNSSFSSTITPTPDVGCSFDFDWNDVSRIICITNTSPTPILVIVNGDLREMYQINPNETVCKNYPNTFYITIDSDTGNNCYGVLL